MDGVFVRYIHLPSTVYGVTVKDENGDFNVYINENLSAPARDRAIEHEMKHIKRGDFDDETSSIEDLEKNMP